MVFPIMWMTAIVGPAVALTSNPLQMWDRSVGVDIQSAACQDFVKFMTASHGEKNGLQTDTLMVTRDGKPVYEWYDGVYDPETPHCMWSATKSIGATLLGAAVTEGAVDVSARLSQFYPSDQRTFKSAQQREFYERIELKDLIAMAGGFEWTERDYSQIKGLAVLDMLYLKGYKDTTAFAAAADLAPEGPGNRYIYSSGSSALVLGALKQVYAKEQDTFPWRLLFDPLEMEDVVFERDQAGNFVASSYVHLKLRDMAKIGQLFINRGVWNGKRVLSESWIDQAARPSHGMLSEGTPIEDLKFEGAVYGEAGMWTNNAIRGLPRFFPAAPDDMIFAAGHYGQVILILPTQNLVIARTGHDKEYFSKINAMVGKALACFGGGRP
ncbi:MAG: serine hydrolase domain-containing protein [Bacteriovoracia bacterium]